MLGDVANFKNFIVSGLNVTNYSIGQKLKNGLRTETEDYVRHRREDCVIV